MTNSFLTRPGGRIAYDDAGSGPLVVLVPSLGDLRQEYRYLMPHLIDAGFRVAAMDLRGHGASSTGWPDHSCGAVGSDVVALIRELNTGSAQLIGTSLGAGAVAWAAAEAPDLTESLVLIGPFVRDIPLAAMQRAVAWAVVNVGLMRPWGPSVWCRYYSSLYPLSKPADFPAYLQALQANLRERGRLEATQAMLRVSKADVDSRLADVRARSLVVMGTRDPDFASVEGGPPGEARVVADRVGGNVLLVDGAGHYPHAEMPEKVRPAIVNFLRTGAMD
jgi:pimeloyl-ACP methyl ester carboxylesterase